MSQPINPSTPGARPRGSRPHHSARKVHWIPKFIRHERVLQGLSQEGLSKGLGFPAKHLSNYETGYYSIRAVYALELMLAALGYELRIHKKHKRRE